MACIILYKGEEIPYAEWVDRLEKGLLDKLINDGTIDIAQFKGEFTPIEKKEEVKKEEVETPKVSKQPTSQAEVKNKLIELGISEEEAEVSSRIYDAYVRNKAAKTGRTIEDVYGDIEFEGGVKTNQVILDAVVEEVKKDLPKVEVKPIEVIETPREEVEPKISTVQEVDTKNQPINKVEDLQDVGEKIGGAKKDLAQKLSEVTANDLETKPLSKVFPKPDFKKLVEEGSLSEDAAILLNFIYEKIPAKPRKQYYVSNWVRTVQGALETTQQILEAESTKKTDFTEKVLKAVTLSETLKRDYKIYSDTMKGLGFPTEQVNLGGYQIRKFENRSKFNKETQKLEPVEGEVYSIITGSSIIGDFPTMEDAINGLKTILNKTEEKTKGTKFDIYQDRKTKEYFIGKKGAIDVVRIVQGFKTLGEARTFLKEKQSDIQSLWDAMKAPKERRMANRPRVGTDWRKGKNIDSKEFADTFGFRGVEFGNWVNNAERQSHVNEAYDALMDLSSVLGVSPKALSLNGELGFAFGARGSGKANAHYEAGKVVINLTKTRGAGSLAHEWWHAMDNYFSRNRGQKESFITQSPRDRIERDGSRNQGVRKEMIDAFKSVMDAINGTNLAERSMVLDKTRSDAYWSTNVEMSARSFENYIIEKLGERNQQNDYLANFKETAEWINDTKGEIDALKNYPYPLAEESPIVNEAFQQFFETIKEDGNAKLYQQEDTSKGKIRFTDLKSIISILKDGDASTFIHELSHHDLQGYIDAAKNGDEKAINSLKAVIRSTYPKISETEVNKKLAEVLKIDRTQENVRGTEYEKIHEHYARGFEKWMKDGDKAGFSAEMVALFEKMKEFLTRIYEGLKLSPIDVQFSPEVEQMYRDMFGVEYKEITEQLKETKELIEEDTTNEILDRDNLDDLFGDLGGGLQQAQQRSYTPKELLLAKAEQLFRNYETDEFNVIEDLKTFVDGLSITDQSKEIYKQEIDKNAEAIKDTIAYDKEVRTIAEKTLNSKETTKEMKVAARKNATYNTMELRGENLKAEKAVEKADKTEKGLENLVNELKVRLEKNEYNAQQGDVATMIQSLQRINAKYERAKANKDTKAIAELQGIHDTIVNTILEMSTKAGQRLNEFKLMKYLIPDMYATSLQKLRERGTTEKERKAIADKLKGLTKKLAKFEADESWATEQLISAEEKIEKQKELLREIQKENEKLREAKKFIEKEEAKSSEKAESNTKTNEQFSTPKVRKFSGSQAVKERIEALRKRRQGGGLQQAMLSDEAEMYETMLDFVGSEIEEGRKVKISSFIKAFDGISDIETLIDAYVSTKNTLIGEVNIKNFSTDSEIETYRKNKLDSAKLAENEKKEEQLSDDIEAKKKSAPQVVAKRILTEAEDRKYLREPKKKDVLQKLKDILTKKAINTFATKPQALKNPNATIAEKLADYLDQELLQQGKDWDVEIRAELEKQIDNSKYSDLDKKQLKEFVNEFLNSRTETLLTNAVSDKIIKEILERGFPTKDGKVDWRDILKKNNNNYNEAKQFLKDELAFEIGSDKLANDVIDAIEKRFEKDSNDRKERFLASEINKALGKEERSKTPRKMNTMLKKLIELSNIGGLNDDVFFKYFAKDFGFETFNQVEMDKIKDYLNKIQALPEGEEKNRMIQELSAYVKIAESEGAFAWETWMSFMYKNMLGHPFTMLVNATSIPTVLAKAFIKGFYDPNYLKIAKEAMFQKAALKTALQQGYKKGGMKFEESGTDVSLPPFDAVEQAFVLADEMDSRFQRGLAKVFANATKYSGLLYLNRFLEGTDSMSRNSAEEMRAYKALKAEIDAEYESRGENPSNNIKAIREEAMRRLYPITNSQALQLAFNEFVSVGVQPTEGQIKRRAFEMQQQMRSDDVRKLAEEEGLRETHRNKPKGYEFLHGSAGVIDMVRLALEGALQAIGTDTKGKDRSTKAKMAQSFLKATQMPFVGVVMNILEKGLELNPIYGGAKLLKNIGVLAGGIKGDRGVLTEKERIDQQKRDVMYNAARVLTGIILAQSLQLLGAFDDDEEDIVELYGNNPQGRATPQTGATLPKNVVSIKLPNGKRLNVPIGYFAVWSPQLAIKAAEQDFRRQEKFKSANLYNELDELHEANKMAVRQYIETVAKSLPMTSAVKTYEMAEKWMDFESDGGREGAYIGNLVTTMALPSVRTLKDFYSMIDTNTYEAKTFKEGFMTTAGFMFNKFYDTRPMYDYRGRLIDIRDRRASSISGVIRSTTKNIDPIDKVLTENNVLIIPTNQNKETDKYQKVDKDGLLTPLTPEENYTNYLEINKKFDAMLTDSTLVKGKPKLGSILDFQELKEKDIKKFMKDGLPKEVAEKKATIEFKKNVQQEYKDLEEKMLLEKGIKKVDTKMKEKDFIKRLKLSDM